MSVGEYETSLRSRVVEVRRRLANLAPPSAKPAPPRPLSPFNPKRIAAENVARFNALNSVAPVPEPVPGSPTTWKQLVSDVSKTSGIGPMDILSPSRRGDIVAARHEVMYRAITELQMGYAQVGRKLKMDHTSVLHGMRRHLQRHPDLVPQYEIIEADHRRKRASLHREVVALYFEEEMAVPGIMRETGLDRNMVNSIIRSEVRKVRHVLQVQGESSA